MKCGFLEVRLQNDCHVQEGSAFLVESTEGESGLDSDIS
jgi:hypothetical protein